MSIDAIVFPVTDQFWSQGAQHLINTMRPDALLASDKKNALSACDFSALQVIVPAYEHAQLLNRVLKNYC